MSNVGTTIVTVPRLPDAPREYTQMWMQRFIQNLTLFLNSVQEDTDWNNTRTIVSGPAGASPYTITNNTSFLQTIIVKDSGTNSAQYIRGSTTIQWYVAPGATAYYSIPLSPGDQIKFTWVTTAPTITIIPT